MRTQVQRNRRPNIGSYNPNTQIHVNLTVVRGGRLVPTYRTKGGREMVKSLRLGLGLIAILSFVALTAIGQALVTASYSQDPEKKKMPETITLNGKVSAIDDMSVTIVDDQKASTTIAIDSKTKISKAGKNAKAADIKADDAVVIEARKGEGDALTAISIKAG